MRAGLALIEAVTKLDAGQATSLQVRVGVATGLVVVGDLLGEGAAQEQAVIGETPNLAARLQGLAEPNTVVIADNTRRLLGGLFDYRDLGTLPVAGINYPVHVWRVLSASQIGSRFEALRAARFFVCRETVALPQPKLIFGNRFHHWSGCKSYCLTTSTAAICSSAHANS